MEGIKNFFTSVATYQGIISIVLVLILIVAVIYFAKRKGNKISLSTRDVVAIGIGAALYTALSFISIPIGPNTSFRIAVALLGIFGAIFGPIVGFLVGFIGHALNDALAYGSVWWSWVFMSASIGLLGGFIKFDKKFNPLAGVISKKNYVQLYIYSLIGIIVGSIIAYFGDVFLYGEPADKVWLQIILAGVTNLIILAVISNPVIIGIGKLRKNNSNLEISE
jgi:energy-coupling factor transport system substrate-specific component